MTKLSRRSFKDLKAYCKKRDWEMHTKFWGAGNSDYIRFDFTVGRISGNAYYDPVNERIFGVLKNRSRFDSWGLICHENTQAERPWFKALLRAIYKDYKCAVKK